MDQEFKPGQIVPESGIYRITHDPQHPDMPHEVTSSRAGASLHAGIARASALSWYTPRSTSAR